MRSTLLLALFFAFSASAQEGAIPEDVLRKLSKDLADLQQAVLAAGQQQQVALDKIKLPGGIAAITVTNANTKVRAGAANGAAPLLETQRGKQYSVIDKTDSWYAVRLDKPIKGVLTGWVSAADAVPMMSSGAIATSVPHNQSESIFRTLTEQAARMRLAYKDNPYVSVTGFQVNVGVPPSVAINFDFK